MRWFMPVLALLLWLLPQPAMALHPEQAFHHYVRDTWSIQQGLPQISVMAIAQDRQGYLWIGTQAGLARFDGVRFRTYIPATEPALPGIWVGTLHAARDGRLWIGTYKGVAVYDGIDFASVPAAQAQRWPILDVKEIAEDSHGTIWVATSAGVFRARDGKLHAVVGAPAPAQSFLMRDDEVWVGARGTVYRQTAQGWQPLPLPVSASAAAINRLVETQGHIWAATMLGLYVFDGNQWQMYAETPQLSDIPVRLLYADSDGNLWAGGDTGIARIRAGHLTEFVAAQAPGGIPGLRTAFEDREGNLWLGSQWQSLIRLWDSWTRRYSQAEGLNVPIVWSVAPDPDGRRIWVGTNNGVSVLDGERFTLVAPGDALPDPNGYNLLPEPGRLWIGTRRGVAVIEHDGPQAGQVQTPPLFAPMATAQINGIVRDADGSLWFVTTEGLYRLTHDAGISHLRHYDSNDGLGEVRTRYLYRDSQGRLLVSTQNGLYEMRGERFYQIGLKSGLPAGLDITTIIQLDDGRLVIGTLSEKIYFQHDGRWQALSKSQGMPANSPFFLAEHDGYLWAAGIRGITRVAVADLTALARGKIEQVNGEMLLNERGDPLSGQQGYCCNGAGNSKGFLRGNTLWLPTRNGVVAFDTDSIVKNTVPPIVVIERIRIDGQWQAAMSVRDTTLEQGARDLGFEFTTLSLQDPKSTTMAYRLVGYNSKWQPADPLNRSTQYTNLSPGNYRFEVRGYNNAGVAANQVAQLAFSVQPYFHETGLFAALLIMLAITVLFAGYRYQQHRYRRQRLALQALVKQRTTALEVANHRLEEASQTDPLTGLRNRRYLANQLPIDLAFYDRRLEQGMHQGEVIVFALVDVDQLGAINAHHDHTCSDLLLQQLARLLSSQVRTGDYLARWMDDNFLFVFRAMPRHQQASLGKRLRETIGKHRFDLGNGQHIHLTASIGLAEYPLLRDRKGQFGWESLIELVEYAVQHVQQHGHDGWAALQPAEGIDPAATQRHERPEILLEQGRLQLIGSHVMGASQLRAQGSTEAT